MINVEAVDTTKNKTNILDKIEMGGLYSNPQVIIDSIDINPNTNTLYIGTSNGLYVISGDNHTKLMNIQMDAYDVAINPNLNKIYVPVFDSVSVISGENNTRIADIKTGYSPYSIAIDEDSNTVYVTTLGSNNITVISGENNTKIWDFSIESNSGGFLKLVFSEESNLLYVTNNDGKHLSVISPINYTKIRDITIKEKTITGFPQDIAINKETNIMYLGTAGPNSSISVISGKTNTKLLDIPFENPPTSLAIDEHSNLLYSLSGLSPFVSVISGKNNTKIEQIPLDFSPSSYMGSYIALNPETNRLYIASNNVDKESSYITVISLE